MKKIHHINKKFFHGNMLLYTNPIEKIKASTLTVALSKIRNEIALVLHLK